MREVVRRIGWLPIVVGVGFPVGFVFGTLLAGGGFAWTDLFEVLALAVVLALGVAFLKGRSMGAFVAALLFVAVGTVAYAVLVEASVWVAFIGVCLMVVVLGAALAGRGQRHAGSESIDASRAQ